jgi:hypothetical protein
MHACHSSSSAWARDGPCPASERMSEEAHQKRTSEPHYIRLFSGGSFDGRKSVVLRSHTTPRTKPPGRARPRITPVLAACCPLLCCNQLMGATKSP